MVKQIQTLLIVLLISISLKAKSQTYLITGRVQQTFSYCGGANPTQKILDNYAKPQAFANKKFYIRKGKKNNIHKRIISEFTTDSTGNFSLKLPQGTYSILVEEQVHAIKSKDYANKFQTVDESCLQAWWQKPYYLLIVEKNNIPLNFSFHHQCYIKNDIPCITDRKSVV